MSSPSIGAITFATLAGRVAPIAMATDLTARKGLDGTQAKEIGLRGALSQLFTMLDVTTAAGAKTHVSDCAALQGGDLVTVTYADGQTCTNVQVVSVVPISVKRALLVAGGISGGAYIARLRWEVFQAVAP